MNVVPTRESLNLAVDAAPWAWLRPHLERGGLVVVSSGLDLREAGFAIAGDDTAAVGAWVSSGQLAKPSAEQLFDWDASPDTPFRFLIVSPYVLIQKLVETIS